MAKGMFVPAELMILIALVLLYQTCWAKDSHDCAPSSCGDIHNISSPFQLKGDPTNCGYPSYNLSCENNQTVLYLFAGKYYVREINYGDHTIRVADPAGIEKDSHSFTPRYFLNAYNFSSGDPYEIADLTEGVVFLKCENPMNAPYYWDISSCFNDEAYSSNSTLSYFKGYRYVGAGSDAKTTDLGNLCRVEQISLTSWPSEYNDSRIISCTGVQDILRYGFQLSWLRVSCERCNKSENCVLDYRNKNVNCDAKSGLSGFHEILFRIYHGFLGVLLNVCADIINKLAPAFIIRNGFINMRMLKYVSGSNSAAGRSSSYGQIILIVVFAGGLLHAIIMVLGTPFVVAFLIYKWRRRHLSMYDGIESFLQSHNNLMPIRYSYSEIKKMTKNFKDKLGEGGYGTVFKGTLRSDRLVAIKRLDKSKTNGEDFMNEVATIGRIHHVNIVQLIGFCIERSKRFLVYEFMSKGSLNEYIFSQEKSILLSYRKMHDIALGVARGIEYLHRGCDIQILHFDIKPHNILLDENFNPKVSDFGLAKLYRVEDSIVSLTAARGTLGYMAPELFYKNIGGVSYKADVYSFGMLLMEMASRRKNLNAYADHSSQIYFPTWIYDQLQDGNEIEMEDATEEEKKIGMKMIIAALWCMQMKPDDRPSMKKVLEMLEGEVECLPMPTKPFLSSPERQIDQNMVDDLDQTISSIQSGESSSIMLAPES